MANSLLPMYMTDMDKLWPETVAGLSNFVEAIGGECERVPLYQLGSRFAEFTGIISPSQRVPLLIHVYKRYREVGRPSAESQERDCAFSVLSILIAQLLKSIKTASREEALAVLSSSFHYCGHGEDVDPPLEMALAAYQGRPFDRPLFKAAACYRERMQGLRSSQAQLMKQRLNWVLWHDPRHPLKASECFTSRIQQGIWSLDEKERVAWEWMLRHVTANMQHKPGRVWAKEGLDRLRRLGEQRFEERMSEWLVKPAEDPVPLQYVGGDVLKLLIWYAGLAARAGAREAVLRLREWNWWERKPMAVSKVLGAVESLLRRPHET